MKAYAASKHWRYTDNTSTRLILASKHDKHEAKEYYDRQSIISEVVSETGFSFSISNWDHSETTLAHSFLETADVEGAEILTNEFLAKVGEKWEVIELPVAEVHSPKTCEDERELIGASSN